MTRSVAAEGNCEAVLTYQVAITTGSYLFPEHHSSAPGSHNQTLKLDKTSFAWPVRCSRWYGWIMHHVSFFLPVAKVVHFWLRPK
jgi:hypothetical protein